MLKLKARPNSNRKKKSQHPGPTPEVVLVWELGPLGLGAGPDPPFPVDSGQVYSLLGASLYAQDEEVDGL